MALHVVGLKTVTTAATAVALASTRTVASWISIQASDGNTAGAKIYVGTSNVSSTNYLASLAPGGSVYLPYVGTPGSWDLSTIYICASANTQSAQVAYGLQ